MNDTLLKEIGINGQKVYGWRFIEIDHSIRLFYEPSDTKGNGFYFYALEITSGTSLDDWWNPKTSCCECKYHGVAYFDGIRHLYMGSDQTDNYGYVYYPNPNDHIKIFEALKELVKTYCPQAE